jgi:hypothetical protein
LLTPSTHFESETVKVVYVHHERRSKGELEHRYAGVAHLRSGSR